MIRGVPAEADRRSRVVGHRQVPDRATGEVTLAFDQLFDRYAAGLHRYLASRAGTHTAEDLVSETYLAAFRRRDTFDPTRGSPQAWLFGIATNQLRDHHRAESRHLAATVRHIGRSDPAITDDGAEERLDAAVAVQRLVPDLLRLNAVDRDILLLNAWGGLSLVEIASALEMPAGTVREDH